MAAKKKMPMPRKTSGRKGGSKMLPTAGSASAQQTKAVPPKDKKPGDDGAPPDDKQRMHAQKKQTKVAHRRKRNIGRS